MPAEPIDGARLANLADAWIGKHCHHTDAARHGISLWVMAQHFRKPDETAAMIWDKFPHLLFIAMRPGSGKTTAMTVAGFLCAPYFFGTDSNPTAPGLCFTIAQEHAAVCIDEAHRLIGPKGTRKQDVVTIMCKSFERRGTYLNGRGGKANRVPVYSPMMIAAKHDPFLTSAGEEIADVIERSHVIYMSKPPEGTELEPVTDATEAQGGLIAQKMAQWAAQQMADRERFGEAVRDARAALAGIGFANRDADVWLAQFTVAALCSPGHLEAACDAALELRRNQPAPGDEDDADPLADLEASLTDGGSLSSWGLAVEPGGELAGDDDDEEQDAPEWPWDGEPPADEEWTEEEPPAEKADGEPPTIDQAPVPDEPYDAWIGVRGGKAEMLAAGEFEDVAKMVCQAKAGTFGMSLRWAVRDGGGWEAGTADIAFAVVPGRAQ